MIRVRGGSGLGDSIYLRPVVDHLVRTGERVIALSSYPDAFIGSGATVETFRRHHFDLNAHYVGGKSRAGTTIWQDVCIEARLPAIPFSFDWKVRNRWLVEYVKGQAGGRPIVLVHGGREPMGRADRFGRELLPDPQAFAAVLSALDGCYLVRIGRGEALYALKADLDMSNRTTVADVLDLASKCKGIVAQCSFALPIAECFDKPFLGVWADAGLRSCTPFIRTVTPQKMLSKPDTSSYVMDNWPIDRLQAAARAFMPAGVPA